MVRQDAEQYLAFVGLAYARQEHAGQGLLFPDLGAAVVVPGPKLRPGSTVPVASNNRHKVQRGALR